MTLIELTIAIAVLAVFTATCAQMMAALSKQVRANERRLLALQTAQAVSEQLQNQPWERLSSDAVKETPLPESVAARLPGAILKVAVVDEADPVAKRITVEITWNGSGAERSAPVRLTSWAFPENAPAPQ
jgi:type II secretory pathway pseudopilin PulG